MRFAKKVLTVLLAFMLVFGALPMNAAAIEQSSACALVMDIHPERTEYQKGEEIQIRTRLYNNSLNDLYNVRVWMEYDCADAMLIPGATERIVDDLPYMHTNDLTFWIYETEFTNRIEATNNSFLKALTLRVVRLVPKLTKFFAFLKNDLQRLFTAFGSLWTSRYTAELGECYVTYNGQDMRCVFKCRYQQTGDQVEIRAAPERMSAVTAVKFMDVSGVQRQ